jgi:hypothetical protein
MALAGQMAANPKSAGLGHSFLALRHAEACPLPEHDRTLDSNTTRQKMLRYQSELTVTDNSERVCNRYQEMSPTHSPERR